MGITYVNPPPPQLFFFFCPLVSYFVCKQLKIMMEVVGNIFFFLLVSFSP